MKRTIAMVMAVLLMVSMLAGCGNTNDKNDKGQTMISVGSWPTKEGLELDAMNARKDRFETDNADVEIVPDEWKFDRRTFYAKAAGNQLPTVYYAGFTEMAEIISSELSADISNVLKKRGYDGMINPAVLKAISNDDGEIKSFPMFAYTLGLAFNADLLKQAGYLAEDGTPHQPASLDEMVEMAIDIKAKTGKAGLVLPSADNGAGWIFTALAWSFGVDFMEKDENGKWHATFNTPEGAAALQWYKDLKWKHDVIPANTLVTTEEWNRIMGSDNAAMSINSGDWAKKVVKFGFDPKKLGMMVMPAGPKRHVVLLGGDVQCLRNDSTEDQIDAGVRWLETANSFKLTEDYKKTTEDAIKTQLDMKQHVGVHNMSVWSSESESLQWYNQYLDDQTNGNPNHVRLYNEFVANPTCEIQAEEPVCCQQLYGILAGCIQEVWTNQDADCAAIMEKANAEFQRDYLDTL
ncbi:MAG: hypothetical protein IKW60_05630 [Clostridia bacterium]|nr:hypothetical protein [Clostridia bacterium]